MNTWRRRTTCRIFGHPHRSMTTYVGRPGGDFWVCHRCGYIEYFAHAPLTAEEWRAFAEGAGFDPDGAS